MRFLVALLIASLASGCFHERGCDDVDSTDGVRHRSGEPDCAAARPSGSGWYAADHEDGPPGEGPLPESPPRGS